MPWVSQLPSGRYRVQYRDATGRKVSAGRSFATKSAARDYGLDREAEVRRGAHLDPTAGRVLLKDWAEKWLAMRVAEPRTLANNRRYLDRYILLPVEPGQRALGDLRLDQIDHMTVQGWVRRLEQHGPAPATVGGVYRLLSTILKAAVLSRLLPTNPCVGVRLPATPPPSDFYWEREEMQAVGEQLTDPLDLAVFETLLGTGMRWGEVAGLHLPRLHQLRRRVAVVDVLSEDIGPFELKAYPKSRRRREVPISEYLSEVLAAHLAANPPADCGLDHGRRRCPGMVFHRDGRPLSRHAWPRQVFTPALKAAGARPGRVHDLRHTYASQLVLDGVPLRVVQELLGHSSSRVTDRYSHLAPSALDDSRLRESLARRGPTREAEREAGS